MMTVIRLFRKQTSAPGFPRWMRLTGEPMTPGGAKPGRGGRRRRKVDRAKIRARIGAGVERKGWPLSWTRRIMVVKSPARVLTDREIAGLAAGPPFVLPMGLELQSLEPTKHPGRRERRRRAKLRRRRARRRAGWTTIPAAPGMRRALAMHWALRPDRDRWRELMMRTPGA